MSQKIISNFLSFASNKGADNLTINACPGNITLDCRLPEGEVLTIAIPPKLEQDFLSVLKRILKLAPGELVNHRPGKIRHPKYNLDFHLTVRSDQEGERIIMNLLNNPATLWRLNQLGLTSTDLKTLRKINSRPGLTAIVSPPNQGKSATLTALLLENNDPTTSIYWLSADQSQPTFSVPGVNYLTAKSTNWDKLLHHDSDIIFADDADDNETLENALRAANSGRRVYIAFTAQNLEEARNIIISVANKSGLDLKNLKAIIHQSLIEWPKPVRSNNLRKRSKIGRFKIWLA